MSEHDEPKTALTRLVGEHRPHFVKSAYPSWECSCGEWDGAMADNGSDTDGRQDTSEGHAAHLADVLLAEGYTTSPAPESISGPHTHDGFQGCTDRDPEHCACATDADPVCAACDEVIEAGEPYYALLKADHPFLSLDHADQDWSAVAWHERCDERTTTPVDRAADEHEEGGQ